MRRASLAREGSSELRKVSDMQIEILGEGAFESALVHLQPGERFISESGALYRASGNVQIDVTTSAQAQVESWVASNGSWPANTSSFRPTRRTTGDREKSASLQRIRAS